MRNEVITSLFGLSLTLSLPSTFPLNNSGPLTWSIARQKQTELIINIARKSLQVIFPKLKRSGLRKKEVLNTL
ncbi:Signal peptide region containing protein, partial [Cryptosporidium hominis]